MKFYSAKRARVLPDVADRRLRVWMSVLAMMAMLSLPAGAKPTRMPNQDVIEVPAVTKGLCVSNLFQSNMVLQRAKPISIWGWADPGQTVTVKFAGEKGSAKAGADRKWKVTLASLPANSKPEAMTVQGEGKTLTLSNILVGDVWVVGGQSNMEFPIKRVEGGRLAIASAHFPKLRMLTIPYGEGPKVKDKFARLYEWSGWFHTHFKKGYWEACTPETVPDMSAIGYIFARRLEMATQIPIGLINVARGGTTVQAWTPLPLLRSMKNPYVKKMLTKWDDKVASWDPQKDLKAQVARYEQRVERMKKQGKAIPKSVTKPTTPRPSPINNPNYPGNCYAGMIGPIEGLAIKGAIFHQGFNNAFSGSAGALMYRAVFPKMITAWRKAFNAPDLPFGIISLCTAGGPQTRDNYVEKMFDAGIYIRAAQYQTFLQFYKAGDKNIGFASTYDLRRTWYHPQKKIPAGERIARWALATQYGMTQLQWKPAMLTGMKVADGKILLTFDQSVGDVQDGKIEGFAIAGKDRRFQLAHVSYVQTGGKGRRSRARVDNKELVLSSPLVPHPTQFRYAWGRNPLANLKTLSHPPFPDIPVATQRSDDWRLENIPLGVLGKDAPSPVTRPQAKKILDALKQADIRRRVYDAEQVIKEYGKETQGKKPAAK